MPRVRERPRTATLLLAGGLAVVSAALIAAAHDGPLLHKALPVPQEFRVLILTGMFFAAELSLLHVEVRRHALSTTLAGLPLVLGIFLVGAPELVGARVVGSALAFVVQRVPFRKSAYNIGAYAAEAALDITLVHATVGPLASLTTRSALICYVIVLVVDQVMTFLVLQVIGWHQGGRLSPSQIAEVHLPALVTSVMATTAALGVLVLIQHGALGALVLAIGGTTLAVVYRTFQGLHRRHRALEQLHHFVGLTGGFGGRDASESDADPDGLAGRLLGEVRSLMQAGTAELLLVDTDTSVQLRVSEDDVLHVEDSLWAAHDELVSRVRATNSAALLVSSPRSPADRAWLQARGVHDAIVVPLPRRSGEGALLVLNRLGDLGSFTAEDQSLLQTLAGHLAVAVRSSTLLNQLRYEATHDVLTGLANRSLLEQTMRSASTSGDGTGGTVMLLDVDRFKEVNDTLGHHVGDDLLRALATTLRGTLPAQATVSRLGGDEFAAFIPDLFDPEVALDLAHTVAHALALPVQLPEALLSARSSIGVALGRAVRSGSDLLRHADTAMYAAKDTGESVVLYSDELDRGRAERLALLADLHLALDRDELIVDYQPKLDLATGQLAGVEALVRWRHPRFGLLLPNVFIPLAERNEVIGDLTQRVLRKALTECARWASDGLDLPVAVNLSARTVNDPALPEIISTALLAAGVPASRLILEITESSLIEDPDRAVATLQRIAAIGVVLSLDDFGTGYSSLAYLRRLPVSEIKIDRSFVSGLTAGEDNSRLLVRGIVSLATSLGHRVVAEGAEDQETVAALRELGCHLVQGYAVSRPTTPEAVTAFARSLPRPTLRAVPSAN